LAGSGPLETGAKDMVDKTPKVGDSALQNTGDENRSFNSGLDAMGQMRIADRITISARGGKLVLTHSPSGREVEVGEESFAGIVEQEYFIDRKD
jgi:hypothetical protein